MSIRYLHCTNNLRTLFEAFKGPSLLQMLPSSFFLSFFLMHFGCSNVLIIFYPVDASLFRLAFFLPRRANVLQRGNLHALNKTFRLEW